MYSGTESTRKSALTQDPIRAEKIKQADTLYQEKYRLLYADTKGKLDKPAVLKSTVEPTNNLKKESTVVCGTSNLRQLYSVKSSSTLNLPDSLQSSNALNSGLQVDKIRVSTFLRGESTKTFEVLRRENENKELRVRELTNKCQNLVKKLKKYLSEDEFATEMESLSQHNDFKMQRIENLFKIKQEEMFFKIKLQVIGLLQEFQVSKEELTSFSDVSQESDLFSMMTRKLKMKLRDFRTKEQETSFEIQKDKILTQKQEERIHFLTETNELLKLSENKLKSKIEDLKGQLNSFLEKMSQREKEHQEVENQLFRLRKQYEDLQSSNIKLVNSIAALKMEREEERRVWETKEKELKSLLNSYFMEKKKIDSDLEEKNDELDQTIIRLKFLEQENQKISRDLVRWKQRFQWIEKEKNEKIKEFEDQREAFSQQFEIYKASNNQDLLFEKRLQIDEALKKIQSYQRLYERANLELQEQRSLFQRYEEQAEERYQQLQNQWSLRLQTLEAIKDEQLREISEGFENRVNELSLNYLRKEELLSEEMQARLKTQIADKDRQCTQGLVDLEKENEELRRQIKELQRVLERRNLGFEMEGKS